MIEVHSHNGNVAKRYKSVNEVDNEHYDRCRSKRKVYVFVFGSGLFDDISHLTVTEYKKLAYEINKKREGYYVLVNFTAESSVPNKLGALLSITSNIMRYIIVAK
jgi:hypothetical protein